VGGVAVIYLEEWVLRIVRFKTWGGPRRKGKKVSPMSAYNPRKEEVGRSNTLFRRKEGRELSPSGKNVTPRNVFGLSLDTSTILKGAEKGYD